MQHSVQVRKVSRTAFQRSYCRQRRRIRYAEDAADFRSPAAAGVATSLVEFEGSFSVLSIVNEDAAPRRDLNRNVGFDSQPAAPQLHSMVGDYFELPPPA